MPFAFVWYAGKELFELGAKAGRGTGRALGYGVMGQAPLVGGWRKPPQGRKRNKKGQWVAGQHRIKTEIKTSGPDMFNRRGYDPPHTQESKLITPMTRPKRGFLF